MLPQCYNVTTLTPTHVDNVTVNDVTTFTFVFDLDESAVNKSSFTSVNATNNKIIFDSMNDSHGDFASMNGSKGTLNVCLNKRAYDANLSSDLSLHTLWHNKLGHLNPKVISSISKSLYLS